jgi:hypothetical protein
MSIEMGVIEIPDKGIKKAEIMYIGLVWVSGTGDIKDHVKWPIRCQF